jgi:PAS domain-containing protein
MLRRRLLLFGALIIVPVAALLFYGVYQQRQEALTAARDGVVRTTRLVSERHRRLLDRTQQLLSVLVNLPQVRQGDWAATNAIFANVVRTVREYPNLRVSDLSGSMVASAFPNAPAGSNRGRDWFEQIIRTSGYAMSGYFLGQTMSGRPEVVMGAPVLDDRGRVRYVLSVTIDVFQFSNVSADELPERSIVNVVGRDGIVLARHPDPQNGIGRQLNPRALMDVMRSGPAEGVLESDGLDGTPRVVGYVTLPVAPASPGVYLLIGVPRDRILAPINRALFINMGGLVLVTVLMLGLGAVGSRILVLAPVDRLLEVTRRIAGGDLSERADDALRRDADEFGQLARGLDDMTARLRERAAERKEAEQRLQESEARYRRIVETATEGIWTLDAAGRTTFVNEAMAAMLGYSPDEMLGMSFLNFMDESVRAEALAAFARREAGVSETLQIRPGRLDQSVHRPHRRRCRPVRRRAGDGHRHHRAQPSGRGIAPDADPASPPPRFEPGRHLLPPGRPRPPHDVRQRERHVVPRVRAA